MRSRQRWFKAFPSAICLFCSMFIACDRSSASSTAPWVYTPDPPPSAAVLRRLTREELAGTFRALIGSVPSTLSRLPADPSEIDAVAPPASSFEVEVYREIAYEAARLGTPQLLERWDCDKNPACLERAASAWIEAAQRRELPDDERATYLAYLTHTGEDALCKLLDLVFQTPHFLYVIENRQGDTVGSWELATRLSYLLWSEPPDEALRADAKSGKLAELGVLEAHAQRMLDDPRAARAIGSTFARWVAPDLAVAAKATSVYPELNAELRASMTDQFEQFAKLALAERWNLEAMLTTRQAPIDEHLAKLLGIAKDELNPQAQWTVITFEEPRIGLVTLPGVLTSRARPDDSSPVQRGLLIRDGMLCQPIPDPPPLVAALPPAASPNSTFRERFNAHTTDPTCAACHRLMDPLGFPFEIYDGIGRVRENSASYATDGKLDGVETPAEFRDIPGLIRALLATPELSRCWAKQWVTRLLGRDAMQNTELVEQISASFADGAALRDILIHIVTSSELRSSSSNQRI